MSLNNFFPTATKTKTTTTTHNHTMNNYTVYNNNTATKTNINGYNNTRISTTMKDDEEEEEINQLKRKRFDNEDEDNEEEEDNNDTFENSNLSFCIDNTEEYPSHPFSQSITSNMSSFFYPFHINSTTTTIPSFDKMSYSTIMMNDNNYFINNDEINNNNNNGIIINESKKKCKLSTQHYLIQFLRECIKNYLLQKCKYCNYCLKRFQQQKQQQICHKEFSTTIMKCKCNNNNNNCNNTKQNNYSITFGLLLDYIVQQSQLYFDTYNYIKQLTNNSLKKIDNDFKLATNEFEELVIEQLHFVKENDELLRTHSFQLVAAERVAVGDKGDNENNNFFRKSLMMANEEGPLLQSHQQQQLGNSIDSIVDFNTLFQSKTYDNLIGCNDSIIEKTSSGSGTMNCQFQSDLNDLLFRNNNINWSGLIKKH